MKKKNKIIILMMTLLVILSLFFLFYFFNKNRSVLTVEEKQWIDNNKNNVIDISILSDVPALTYNGEGLVFDYLDYFTKQTDLSFNTIATKSDDINTNYSVKLVDKVKNNDIKLYDDNYVFVSKDGNIYHNISEINNKVIGILESDLKSFSKKINTTNTFISYKTIDELTSSEDITGMIALKSQITDYMIKNNLNISYHFAQKKYYVLNLNGDNSLNSILRKNYDKWKEENYNNSFNKNLLNTFYYISEVDTLSQTDLKSKNYTYGFVENGIYDYLKSNKLNGINHIVIKKFSDFADLKIKYKKYNSISDLKQAYKNNEVDIIFNDNLDKKNNVVNANINSNLVIISSYKNKANINDLSDINKEVSVVKNSKIEKYLKDNNVKVKSYKNMDILLSKIKDNDLVGINSETYDFYKTRGFKNFKIDYTGEQLSYNYLVNNESKVFAQVFNFYINYTDLNLLISENYNNIAYKTINYYYALLFILFLCIIFVIMSFIKKIKKLIKQIVKKHRSTLTKEDKIKYIDQLTSLKNRAYLNSKVEKWDDSEVYPQCVIVIDLNNIAYINDNYGREEGDMVIAEAANVLIQSQLPNTEIIRTDGNEFLIFLVGYKEKDIITYLRRVSRALKNIKHGFGAAAGYSMILDAIKTFDDAVNEATIEMKQNKEDRQQ